MDLGFLVDMSGDNLGYCTVRDAAKSSLVFLTLCSCVRKSVVEISRELHEGALRVRKGEDTYHKMMFTVAEYVPTFILRPCKKRIRCCLLT